MPTQVRSFSKINLGLAVGAPRPDGFHSLTTLYQTLALHDRVTVAAEPAAHTCITIEANHPGVPSTAMGDAERNTAFRLVAATLLRLGVTAEVHITLDKQLPVQGGLGAGSANAAAALLALEHELGRALPGPDRLQVAAEIGSDVPLFLLGGTVLGLNRGEAVYPFPDPEPDLPALPVVVATPSVGVSTAQAFRDLDALSALHTGPPALRQSLTQGVRQHTLEELSRVLASTWALTGMSLGSSSNLLEAGRRLTGIANVSSVPKSTEVPSQSWGGSASSQPRIGDRAENPGSPADLVAGVIHPLLALVRTGVENDFESVAFRQHPSLRDIKRALAGSSNASGSKALYAALSGSGSALFGIYPDSKAALEAQQRVHTLGTRALLTETLSRREYWRQMFA